MVYKLQLLPTDAKSLPQSRLKLMEMSQSFVSDMLRYKGMGSLSEPLEEAEINLMKNILDTRFWGILHNVDGTMYNPQDHTTTEKAHQERTEKNREWGKKRFMPHQLEQLLNIAANQALLKPLKTSWPGTYRGHSILYRELLSKEDSIFKEAVTPEFKRRLNNGRFWEELPDVRPPLNHGMGIRVVYDVLMNYFDDLDPEFAKEGLALTEAERASQQFLDISLSSLGEDGMGRYVSFLEKIDERDVIKPTKVEMLLQPYLRAVLQWDRDMEGPYYNGLVDYDDEKRGRFQDKLQLPLVQKYLGSSQLLRESVAKQLSENVRFAHPQQREYAQFMQEVLSILPKNKKLMKAILKEMHAEAGLKFFAQGKEHGYDLFAFLD